MRVGERGTEARRGWAAGGAFEVGPPLPSGLADSTGNVFCRATVCKSPATLAVPEHMAPERAAAWSRLRGEFRSGERCAAVPYRLGLCTSPSFLGVFICGARVENTPGGYRKAAEVRRREGWRGRPPGRCLGWTAGEVCAKCDGFKVFGPRTIVPCAVGKTGPFASTPSTRCPLWEGGDSESCPRPSDPPGSTRLLSAN